MRPPSPAMRRPSSTRGRSSGGPCPRRFQSSPKRANRDDGRSWPPPGAHAVACWSSSSRERPTDFARIREARAQLIGFGATIVAPCPHDAACPIVAPDWCHFAVRLPRSRDHRITKDAVVAVRGREILLCRRGARDDRRTRRRSPASSRHRASTKAASALKLCTPAGIVERTVPRRDRAAFAALRRARWGDAIHGRALSPRNRSRRSLGAPEAAPVAARRRRLPSGNRRSPRSPGFAQPWLRSHRPRSVSPTRQGAITLVRSPRIGEVALDRAAAEEHAEGMERAAPARP